MSFTIRKIEHVSIPLTHDLDNISEVDLNTLLQAWRGSRKNEVESKLEEKIARIDKPGNALDFDGIGKVLTQRGLECQTMAILNGMKSFFEARNENFESLIAQCGGLPAIIHAARSRAHAVYSADKSKPQGSLDMGAVGQSLKDMGFPLVSRFEKNPVHVASSLERGAFAGLNDDDRDHATTLIALNGRNDRHYAELDSLSGAARPMNIRQFVQRTLDVVDRNQNLQSIQVFSLTL